MTQEISPASPAVTASVTSFFRYDGLIRNMIRRVKINGDQPALAFLLALWGQKCTALLPYYGSTADCIVACPSSLWGRLRGRLDLAYHLGHQLAGNLDLKLQTAPMHLYWRLNKEARQLHRRRPTATPIPRIVPLLHERLGIASFERNVSWLKNDGRLLVVDDVVTTGATLNRVSAAVTFHAKQRTLGLLTLATALRPSSSL